MKIIIVGCGKVGTTIAEELYHEGHDITVIDQNAATVQTITENIDVMGLTGNGAVYQVQIEAGIQDADLLIATTNSDELNMLCCLIAKKAGDCHTIARIRNPEYSSEVTFIREELNLSMAINPELAAAREISSIIKWSQIRINLTLQITWQKSQLLSRLNRRSGENDPSHLAIFKRLDSHSHSQISLTCSCRTDTKHHHLLADRVHIIFLSHGLWLYRSAVNGMADHIFINFQDLVIAFGK